MSNRIKRTTLFNKNHITLVKISNLENCDGSYASYETSKRSYEYTKDYLTRYMPTTEKEEIKCESPLGFYYTKTVYKRVNHCFKTNEYAEVRVRCDDFDYILTYLRCFDDVKINKETRPWEIVKGDKGIADHFIKSLYDEVEKIFNLIKERKMVITEYFDGYHSDPTKHDFYWLKCKVYEDLFGDKDGLKIQTDSEKILSHGFDLKTSFRKM